MQTFVERQRWVTEDTYMELLALGSCLPGPTSTQVPLCAQHGGRRQTGLRACADRDLSVYEGVLCAGHDEAGLERRSAVRREPLSRVPRL